MLHDIYMSYKLFENSQVFGPPRRSDVGHFLFLFSFLARMRKRFRFRFLAMRDVGVHRWLMCHYYGSTGACNDTESLDAVVVYCYPCLGISKSLGSQHNFQLCHQHPTLHYVLGTFNTKECKWWQRRWKGNLRQEGRVVHECVQMWKRGLKYIKRWYSH